MNPEPETTKFKKIASRDVTQAYSFRLRPECKKVDKKTVDTEIERHQSGVLDSAIHLSRFGAREKEKEREGGRENEKVDPARNVLYPVSNGNWELAWNHLSFC